LSLFSFSAAKVTKDIKTAKKTTEKRQNELKLLKEKEVFKKTE